MPWETFPPLAGIGLVVHAFTLRTDDDTKADDYPARVVRALGFPAGSCASAEQPHGNGVAVVETPLARSGVGAASPPRPGGRNRGGDAAPTTASETCRLAGRIPGVDALVTRQRNLPLVVRCADCAAVYLVDRQTPAIGLAHSGKKGTQANVAGAMFEAMRQQFGTDPGQCRAVISPSIGPCHYEMDLWTKIDQQLRDAGVTDIHNPRVCTACHLDRYFSYRAERGQTGRMLAVLALRP